jgi:hypothetical protein
VVAIPANPAVILPVFVKSGSVSHIIETDAYEPSYPIVADELV